MQPLVDIVEAHAISDIRGTARRVVSARGHRHLLRNHLLEAIAEHGELVHQLLAAGLLAAHSSRGSVVQTRTLAVGLGQTSTQQLDVHGRQLEELDLAVGVAGRSIHLGDEGRVLLARLVPLRVKRQTGLTRVDEVLRDGDAVVLVVVREFGDELALILTSDVEESETGGPGLVLLSEVVAADAATEREDRKDDDDAVDREVAHG